MDNLLLFLYFVFQTLDFLIIPFYTPKCGVNLDRFTPHFGVKHWTFHDYSILYTEMWGKSGQIYPTFRCIKWIIFYCFCISCFKHWTFHDYSILYTEMWGKSGQIYPTFRCIKWIIFYCFCISCFKHWTFHDYCILYTEMWGKSGYIVSVFRVSNTGLFMIIPFYTPKCG